MDNIKIEFVEPSVKLLHYNDINKYISDDDHTRYKYALKTMEYVGRVCYNSYDKMCNDSHVDFLHTAAKHEHMTIFEFSNIFYTMTLPFEDANRVLDVICKNKFLNIQVTEDVFNEKLTINTVGSFRTYIELLKENCERNEFVQSQWYIILFNELDDKCSFFESFSFYDILYIYYGTVNPYIKYDYKFIDLTLNYNHKFSKFLYYIESNKSVSHELVRHRLVSHMQESQRYVKIDVEQPVIFCLSKSQIESCAEILKPTLIDAIKTYLTLLTLTKRENARNILPNCIKTKNFIYSDKQELMHIFRMRLSNGAYEPCRIVVSNMQKQMINKNLF